MPSQISVPSSRRYITAATLLDAIQAISPGAGSAPVTVDLQPVLDAIAQLSNKVTMIDRDNDIDLQLLESKIMSLMTAIEQIQNAFGTMLSQQQQLVSTAETAAATAATANAAAEALRQSNELLSANDQADATTIANLQADVTTKEQALIAAQQQAAQAQADRAALQLQMDQAEAALRAILDGQGSNPPAE